MYKIGVLVLDLNRSDDTIACIGRIVHLNDNSISVSVLVNGSDDLHKQKIFSSFGDNPAVDLHYSNINLGFTGGMNYLFQKLVESGSVPKYLLLLNNDALIEKNTLYELSVVMDQDETIAIATPTVVSFEDNSKILEAGIRFYPWLMQHFPVNSGRRFEVSGNEAATIRTTVANGTCMMVQAEVFSNLGGFDNSFFAYFEDWDLCLRALAQGYSVVHVHNAVVAHKGSATTGKNTVLYQFLICRNRYLIAKKHLPIPVFFLLFIPYYMIRVITKSVLLLVDGNLAGLKGYGLALCWIVAPAKYREMLFPDVSRPHK